MRVINHLNIQATNIQCSGNNLYKRGYVPQTQDTTNLIKKKLHVGNKIIVLFKILTHFPVCNAKEAPIHVMSNYDPPTAQHNDHSQMYHSRNIIESHEQITTNTCMSVINELITTRIIKQGDRRWHSTATTNLLICLNTYIFS